MFCCTISFPIIPHAQHWMQVSQMVQLHPTKGFSSLLSWSQEYFLSIASRSLGWISSVVSGHCCNSPVYQHRFLSLLLLLAWICHYFISRSLIAVLWRNGEENDSIPLTLWAWLWEGGEASWNLCSDLKGCDQFGTQSTSMFFSPRFTIQQLWKGKDFKWSKFSASSSPCVISSDCLVSLPMLELLELRPDSLTWTKACAHQTAKQCLKYEPSTTQKLENPAHT